MKANNLSRDLITSYSTFHNLIIPILALNQLAVAGFGAYVSSYFNNKLGSRKSLTFLHRHFWTMVLFFVLAILSKQFRMFTRRETPFVILTGVLGIFLKAQLTSKCRSTTSPYYLSLWQPLLPVFVQAATIFLGMEKLNQRKGIGMAFCFISCAAFLIYQNWGENDIFDYNFFMFVQIVVPGISSITTKKAIGADSIGLFNLGFWISLFGVIGAWFYYSCQYFVNPMDSPYFHWDYQLGLLDCGAIFVFVVFVDCFNLSCLMYITKTGQVSKAAVYSTLNATWTIVFGIIQSKYEWFILIYLVGIYTGYAYINYDKKLTAAKAKKAKVKVRFIKRVKGDYEVLERRSIHIGSDIDDEELMEKIGKLYQRL